MDCSAPSPTFNELLACSAPLVFSDPDGDNIFFGGTCFRASFAGRTYVVTARHCITNRKVNLAATRVECATTEQITVPLTAWHLLGTKLPDTDHSDIAIFEVGLDEINPRDRQRVPSLDVERYPLPKDFKVGYRLMVEGFSSRLADIDYEERRWVRGSEKLEARYDGPSETGTSKLTFVDPGEVKDLDGFSGAPVFAFKQPTATTFVVGFAGMLIRAKYFINSDIIIEALKKTTAHAFKTLA